LAWLAFTAPGSLDAAGTMYVLGDDGTHVARWSVGPR
jgi:hypothetical protein